MKKALIPLVFFLWCSKAFAIFGIGDIVFDPSNFAQAVSIVNQNYQQISHLAAIAGINTQQLTTLNSLMGAVGRASDIAQYPRGATPDQLLRIINSVPGMEGFTSNDLGKLFNQSGALDVFMGTPVSDWQKMVRDPMQYFGNTLRTDAIRAIGGELGMTDVEKSYADWVLRMTPEQRAASGTSINRSGANLIIDHWYTSVEDRRKAEQQLAAKVRVQEQNAGTAKTTNELLAAQSAQATTSNEILIHSAVENAKAQEAQVAAQQSETTVLQDQVEQERIRRAAERVRSQ